MINNGSCWTSFGVDAFWAWTSSQRGLFQLSHVPRLRLVSVDNCMAWRYSLSMESNQPKVAVLHHYQIPYLVCSRSTCNTSIRSHDGDPAITSHQPHVSSCLSTWWAPLTSGSDSSKVRLSTEDMSLTNVYHLRRVADTSAKACLICFKPSTSVLITPDNKVRIACNTVQTYRMQHFRWFRFKSVVSVQSRH